MAFVGSYFGMGTGNLLFIIVFFLIGMIIGLHTKFLSSLSIFLFIYIGSLFGNGQGKVILVFLFFIFGIYIIMKLKKRVKKDYPRLTKLF
jgi:hypothetical protein